MSFDNSTSIYSEEKKLQHGGRLGEASVRYGIGLTDWLDLSTGINPQSYPLQMPPVEIWQRLPEADDGLEATAASYYWPQGKPNNAAILPVAGSQAAIKILPLLRKQQFADTENQTVTFISPSYQEHLLAWSRAGFRTRLVCELDDSIIAETDILVLINPNNPTGVTVSAEQLLNWHQQLQARCGWLVVDEAFIDCTPEFSIVDAAGRPGLIILRSLGKFFGLAGVRVGFVLGQTTLLADLDNYLGPWTVAGPSRWAAQHALADCLWQRQQRNDLMEASLRLEQLLRFYRFPVSGGCHLFKWLIHADAKVWHEELAKKGILSRYFADFDGLRLGLPGHERDWQRLEIALSSLSNVLSIE